MASMRACVFAVPVGLFLAGRAEIVFAGQKLTPLSHKIVVVFYKDARSFAICSGGS